MIMSLENPSLMTVISKPLLFYFIAALMSLLKPVLCLNFVITDMINICPFCWTVSLECTISSLFSYKKEKAFVQ